MRPFAEGDRQDISKGVTVINAVQINDHLAVTGQVIPEQLQQATQEGYRSVLNLRSPDELGFLSDEQHLAESLGLHYVNVPLKLEALSEELVSAILAQLDQMPKPVVLHCAAGFRSAAIALLSVAIQEGLTPDQVLIRARSLGFKFFEYACVNPQLKQQFIHYLVRHTQPLPTSCAGGY